MRLPTEAFFLYSLLVCEFNVPSLTSFRDQHTKMRSHSPKCQFYFASFCYCWKLFNFGLSSCPCKQLMILLRCTRRVCTTAASQFYFWLKEIGKEKYIYSHKYWNRYFKRRIGTHGGKNASYYNCVLKSDEWKLL